MRDYCTRRGWEIIGEYVDAGVSGARERRPDLDHPRTRALRSSRSARPQGKRIGRPCKDVDAKRVAELRAQRWSRAEIAREMRAGLGTVHRAAQSQKMSTA